MQSVGAQGVRQTAWRAVRCVISGRIQQRTGPVAANRLKVKRSALQFPSQESRLWRKFNPKDAAKLPPI